MELEWCTRLLQESRPPSRHSAEKSSPPPSPPPRSPAPSGVSPLALGNTLSPLYLKAGQQLGIDDLLYDQAPSPPVTYAKPVDPQNQHEQSTPNRTQSDSPWNPTGSSTWASQANSPDPRRKRQAHPRPPPGERHFCKLQAQWKKELLDLVCSKHPKAVSSSAAIDALREVCRLSSWVSLCLNGQTLAL